MAEASALHGCRASLPGHDCGRFFFFFRSMSVTLKKETFTRQFIFSGGIQLSLHGVFFCVC